MITLSRSAASKDGELNRHRMDAIAQVNNMIAATRLKYITDIPGQPNVYTDKEAEAVRFLSQIVEPTDLTDYPFIASESDAIGMTAHAVAQMFVNLAAVWRPLGANLEGLRRGFIVQIEQADAPAIAPLIEAIKTELEPY